MMVSHAVHGTTESPAAALLYIDCVSSTMWRFPCGESRCDRCAFSSFSQFSQPSSTFIAKISTTCCPLSPLAWEVNVVATSSLCSALRTLCHSALDVLDVPTMVLIELDDELKE